jgi:hypothetical protein
LNCFAYPSHNISPGWYFALGVSGETSSIIPGPSLSMLLFLELLELSELLSFCSMASPPDAHKKAMVPVACEDPRVWNTVDEAILKITRLSPFPMDHNSHGWVSCSKFYRTV